MKQSPRLVRKLADAMNGNEIEVFAWYKSEIYRLKSELRKCRNGFNARCIIQEIETLKNEYNVIDSNF